MEASRGCEAPLVEKKNCSREVEHAKGKVREICVCGDRLCVRLRGKKTWTKWGLNPRPHATGLTMRHHELAKQARYHCAIRPLVVILEVKNTYGRPQVRLSATCGGNSYTVKRQRRRKFL